jgi:lipopolysaccharide export system permease protein
MTLYIAKMFAVRVVAVLLMLVMVLQALDLLSESGEILAVHGNGQAQLLTYVGLRAQLVARFLPYSVLLATIITLITLNQNSEVIAMKAAGISAHQMLAPLFLVAAVISVGNFAFNERIVTRSTATLKAWQDAHYGPMPTDTTARSNVWLQDGPTSSMPASSAARARPW